MKPVVKRKGHSELFDERKVYASSYAACLNVHLEEKICESIANSVSTVVGKWVKKKKQVDSDQIFKEVIKNLKKHNQDAAFMYETHRDLS